MGALSGIKTEVVDPYLESYEQLLDRTRSHTKML